MCRVVELNIDGRLIRVADVKQKYMANIIDAALKFYSAVSFSDHG